MFFNLKKIVYSVLKNDFWMSVGFITFGNALAQLLGLLSTPIITRIYSPFDFGQYALLNSIASILISFISLGLPSAIMLTSKPNESKSLFAIITFNTILISSVLFLFFLFLFINNLLPFFTQDFYLQISFIYILVIINSIKSSLLILANKFRMNTLIFITSLISAGSTILFSIPLGLLYFTQYGLIISSLLSGIISIFYLTFHFNPLFVSFSFKDFFYAFVRFKNFIFFQFPSNIIEVVSNQLPNQFISQYYGSNYLGYFHMNEKLLGIPSRFIGVPINTIYFRTASEFFNSGKDLGQFTYSIISKIMLLSFFPVFIIIFFGEPLFGFFLGETWTIAGEISKYLIVVYVFNFAANVTSYLRVSINKQFFNFLGSILKILILGFIFLIGVFFRQTFLSFVQTFVIALSVFNIFDMTMNFIILKKYYFKYFLLSSAFLIFCIISWYL